MVGVCTMTTPAVTPAQSASYTSDMRAPAPHAEMRNQQPGLPWQRHPAAVAVVVVGLHVGALWALQTGLLRRAVEAVVPAEILVQLWSPPAPEVAPAPQPRPAAAPPRKAAAPTTPAPVPLAVTTPAPVPENAPVVPLHSAQVATNTVAAPAISTGANDQNGTKKAASNAPVAAPKIELPSSDADYLNNPKPPYPLLSKRMGEQGRVVVRTLIGTDGHAQDVQLHQSSGFDRLDQAALNAARQWRYVPGKRDGVPQAMWFNVPFTFQLQ